MAVSGSQQEIDDIFKQGIEEILIKGRFTKVSRGFRETIRDWSVPQSY